MGIATRRGARLHPPFFTWLVVSLGAAGLLVTKLAYAEPLNFNEALALAEQQSPDLAAQAAMVEAARSTAVSAGRLPDPKLIVGIDNLPATGPDQWSLTRDFMTMQKIGVMQEVPNAKKRHAEVDAANADIHRAEAEQRTQRLAVRRAVALAWFNRYYLEKRLALFDQLDRENQLFADTVQAQLATSRSLPADALVPKQEAAELADRRDALNADILKAKTTLRRYVGQRGGDLLPDAAPVLAIDIDHLRIHVHEHPELIVFASRHDVAQAELQAAQASKRPDWGLELAYARRGPMFSDMVSAEFTIGLPLFSGSRQDPQIASKRQALSRIDAEREAMLRDHIEALDQALADDETLKRQLARLHDTRLLLAQQKVELQMASYRGGKTDLNAVLNARRELIEVQLKAIELESQRAAIVADLYFAYGEGAQ